MKQVHETTTALHKDHRADPKKNGGGCALVAAHLTMGVSMVVPDPNALKPIV
jgi:hypothetical protein